MNTWIMLWHMKRGFSCVANFFNCFKSNYNVWESSWKQLLTPTDSFFFGMCPFKINSAVDARRLLIFYLPKGVVTRFDYNGA